MLSTEIQVFEPILIIIFSVSSYLFIIWESEYVCSQSHSKRLTQVQYNNDNVLRIHITKVTYMLKMWLIQKRGHVNNIVIQHSELF